MEERENNKEKEEKNKKKEENNKEKEENNKEKEENSEEEIFYEEDLEKIINSNNSIEEDDLKKFYLLNKKTNFPNQYQYFQQDDKDEEKRKIILNEIIQVEYEEIPYQLFIYIKEDKENCLSIELIPKEGHLPYSYRNILDEKSFYEINSIFKELKTIEKIGKKILGLFNKKRASLAKDKNEDLFYLILRITIIDEDKEILIPLNKNENIQISTINYLLREAKEIKKDFIKNNSEIKDKIRKELKEINVLKKVNTEYLDIINKIKEEVKKEKEDDISDDEDEDNKNKIIDEKNNDKDNEIDKDSLLRISQMIIDQNEEYIKIENKINKIEKDIFSLINSFKCEISPQCVMINVDINHIKPYINFHFEIDNIGKYAFTSKCDDIYCIIEGISPEIITFLNPSEKYIFLNQNFLPKQKINVCKKVIINNPTINTKYDFYISIYSLAHGKVSVNSIKIMIYVKDEVEKEANFISFLHNKKLDFDIKNKKIIFEYFKEDEKTIENNKNSLDIRIGYKRKRIKIYKYLYDDKSGMAENNNEEKDKIDAFVVINKGDIDKIIKKIYDKYEKSRKIEKYIIEDIICTCAGDFQKICELLDNKLN